MNDNRDSMTSSDISALRDLEQELGLSELSTRKREFNLFEALGMVRQEIRHSYFLTYLLDPSESHGLGERFLRDFLVAACTKAQNGEPNTLPRSLTRCTVQREWNYMDIIIRSDADKFVCVVENKIDAKEHGDQLSRYRELVTQECRDYQRQFIFLTPDRAMPSDDEYVAMDYGQIRQIIHRIIEDSAVDETSPLGIALRQYSQLIGDHIMSNSEVAKLCREIYGKHRRAVDLLIEHKPDTTRQIAEHVKALRAEGARSHGIVEGYTGNSTYFAFTTTELQDLAKRCTNAGWNPPLEVFIEFENFRDDLAICSYIGEPGSEKLRTAALEHARKRTNELPETPSRYLKGAMRLHRKQLLGSRDFDSHHLEHLTKIIDAEWQSFLSDDLPRVVSVWESMKIPVEEKE